MPVSRKNKGLWIALVAVIAVLAALIICAIKPGSTMMPEEPDPEAVIESPQLGLSSEHDPKSTPEPSPEPTAEPPAAKISTATIGAVGDILMHDAVIRSGYDRESGSYIFDYIFEHFSKVVSQLDYAVADLEGTLCAEDNGYGYSGRITCFNCPDSIVDALKNAGFDMLLTANNHSYDTRSIGLIRTQQIITEKGLDYIGTRMAPEDKNYLITDVNGIKIGMINYSFNTNVRKDGSVSLNGIPVTIEDSKLVNSFNYYYLPEFYSQLEGDIAAMRDDGAESIVLYIHWGHEYQIVESRVQNEMAQAICNLGVDVIVGNHVHVPQPVELLTNENDESKKTLCIYSTGNSVSAMRRGGDHPVQVEDGLMFTFTFAKYSDGTVLVEHAEVIPTWVDYYAQDNLGRYKILVMDGTEDEWKADMALTDNQLWYCQNSHKRTMQIVGEGIEKANEYFALKRETVEELLGIE